MHHFTYRDGRLHAEDVDLRHLADTFGTPFYCYSSATLERHYRVFAEAFAGTDALVCYAVKANSNQAVLATLARLGAGMDIVSEGELRRALAAKVPAERIVFSGIGKTQGRDGGRPRCRHPLLQRRIGARAGGARRGRGREGPACADLGAGQPGRRREDPPQDRDRQVGEQVRHPDRARPRGLCRARRGSRP